MNYEVWVLNGCAKLGILGMLGVLKMENGILRQGELSALLLVPFFKFCEALSIFIL